MLRRISKTTTIAYVYMLEKDPRSKGILWTHLLYLVLLQCPDLEHLSLTTLQGSNEDDREHDCIEDLQLQLCKNLKHLSLYTPHSLLTDDDLIELISLPKLESLDLRNNYLSLRRSYSSVSPRGEALVEEMVRASGLRTLDLRGVDAYDQAFVYVEAFADGPLLAPFVAKGLQVLEDPAPPSAPGDDDDDF